MRNGERTRMAKDADGGEAAVQYKLPHPNDGSDTDTLPKLFADRVLQRAWPAPLEDDQW
jgi:hypothetical protein